MSRRMSERKLEFSTTAILGVREFITKLLQHFVALVKNEILQILEVEFLGPHKGQNTSRSAHHDVGTVVLQHLLVFLDG